MNNLDKIIQEQLKYAEEHKEEFEAARRNCPDNFANWFPFVQKSGVPHPKTIIVDLPTEALMSFINSEGNADTDIFIGKMREALKEVGYPAFIRGSQMSGKHSWHRTCFVKEYNGDLYAQVAEIIGEHDMAWGVQLPSCFAVRELLPTSPVFYAFHGFMPVTKERRYFVENGKVKCHHPYWPDLAIDGNHPANVLGEDVTNWRELLAEMNEESPEEVGILTAFAERIGSIAGGSWSIDFLYADARGWFCIDMARANRSFHWPWCENASQEMRDRYLKKRPEIDISEYLAEDKGG